MIDNTEMINVIVSNVVSMGYSSKDLIIFSQFAWDCLPLGYFKGGIHTKVFENIDNAIKILESKNV